jgi:hypothetical protein
MIPGDSGEMPARFEAAVDPAQLQVGRLVEGAFFFVGALQAALRPLRSCKI